MPARRKQWLRHVHDHCRREKGKNCGLKDVGIFSLHLFQLILKKLDEIK